MKKKVMWGTQPGFGCATHRPFGPAPTVCGPSVGADVARPVRPMVSPKRGSVDLSKGDAACPTADCGGLLIGVDAPKP